MVETIWTKGENQESARRRLKRDVHILSAEGLTAWDAEVRVTVIMNGALESASNYLLEVFEHNGQHPSRSNPEISGYELQMTQEAFEELKRRVGSGSAITRALDILKLEQYKAQKGAA